MKKVVSKKFKRIEGHSMPEQIDDLILLLQNIKAEIPDNQNGDTCFIDYYPYDDYGTPAVCFNIFYKHLEDDNEERIREEIEAKRNEAMIIREKLEIKRLLKKYPKMEQCNDRVD